jgi:signal transduction histidine kinase
MERTTSLRLWWLVAFLTLPGAASRAEEAIRILLLGDSTTIGSVCRQVHPDGPYLQVVQHLAEIPQIVCAPAQINQVILNLLLNAQQAITAARQEGGRIEISTWASRNEVTLEITDNGCGIPAEIHSRIFDPSFTTKPIGEGTGLGLSISHSIVSDHGGRIELESTRGQAARFRFTLPVKGKGMDDAG